MSLERALSKLGAASRSEARMAILAGRVRVDGGGVHDPAMPVVPERARIELDGRLVDASRGPRRTLMLHKPAGYITTRHDPAGRPTVFDLLPGDPPGRQWLAAGRLDQATSGLLLLTTDARVADYLTDPRNEVPRVYLVTVRGRVEEATARGLERGARVDGEALRAARVEIRKASGRESHLVVELRSGRNREVRRLCAAAGHPVTRLRRVSFGPLVLGRLPAGEFREVGARELEAAFPALASRRAGRGAPEARPRRESGAAG